MLTKKIRRMICKAVARGGREDYLASRARLAARIAACEEGGSVATVQSGMDCDCSRYDGWVSIIPASVTAYIAALDRVERSADGPFSLRIEKPSVAEAIPRTSRDLALEAFENGHAHYICG